MCKLENCLWREQYRFGSVIVLASGQRQRATRSLYHPSPCWGGQENGKKKEKKFLGRDKGSLTEQQTKGTVTTTILIRRIHKTNSKMHRGTLTTRCLARSQAMTAFPPASSPTGTQHGGTWYQIPCSVWPVWISQLAVSPPSPPGFW